jgi:thiosulfate/3-mercaptopyruvate sulfurtransferase
VFITPAKLAAELAGPRPPVLLDVRWALGDPNGRAHYLAGHIPSAVFVDLDAELSAVPTPTSGRHPLPDPADLQAAARRWGLREGDAVVAYDNTGGVAAARAWWLLRWAGLAEVRLLDGGLGGWSGALATGIPDVTEGDVTLSCGHLPVLDADETARFPASGLLLDARPAGRYRGEFEPIDPVAGHIPGAVSAPTTDNLDEVGAFLNDGRLAARFAALGLDSRPVAVYCGSGVTAAHQIAALAAIGIPAALYAGSWSAWCADPARPVATGPEPFPDGD